MADIRQTGLLDDFDSQGAVDHSDFYPEGPTAPWYSVPGTLGCYISSGGVGGSDFPPSNSSVWFSAASFYGGNVEMWGEQSGSPALTAGWRFGMFTLDSMLSGGPSGYSCIPWDSIGGASWDLRRYDNGGFTGIDSTTGSLTEGLALMRRNGSLVETWHSLDNGATWTQYNSASDTTYVNGPWVFFLGTTGTETGWDSLGGGVRNRAHIYRILKGLS